MNAQKSIESSRSSWRVQRWHAVILCLLISLAVVAWGTGYKLSLYRASSLFHKIPEAKLLKSCSGEDDQQIALKSHGEHEQSTSAGWSCATPAVPRLCADELSPVDPSANGVARVAWGSISLFRRPPPSSRA